VCKEKVPRHLLKRTCEHDLKPLRLSKSTRVLQVEGFLHLIRDIVCKEKLDQMTIFFKKKRRKA
jgi:hypothetical protein